MIDNNTLEEQIELVDKYISFYEQDFMGAESYLKNFWKKSDFIQLLLGPNMYKEYPNFESFKKDVYEKIEIGLKQVEEGKYRPARECFKELEEKYDL